MLFCKSQHKEVCAFDWCTDVRMAELLMEKYGPFMDMNDLSDLLKIKKQSMYQQIYHGRLNIPHAKLGKKYLFPTHEVAAYMTKRISVY